jgi:hypothetical protein
MTWPRKRPVSATDSTEESPAKRTRPDLSNGFSGLSISPGAPLHFESSHETPDEALDVDGSEIEVEELPESSGTWSDTSSDDGNKPGPTRVLQHADVVELPEEPEASAKKRRRSMDQDIDMDDAPRKTRSYELEKDRR